MTKMKRFSIIYTYEWDFEIDAKTKEEAIIEALKLMIDDVKMIPLNPKEVK